MTKEEQQTTWVARIAAFKASGQSVPKWCAANNIKPHQLRYRLKKEAHVPTGAPTWWLPLNLSDPEPSPISIKVGQAVIEVQPGFDPKLLLNVVSTLSRL